MDKPVLTIGIPTYNQPKELKRLLNSIEPQWDEGVEVFVKDDSEGDESEVVVGSFSDKFPITYEKGKKEGLDKAILSITQKANGKYVWWIGDDSLAPGAVELVLKVVKKQPETSFVFLNSLEENVQKPAYDLGPNRFFKDKNEVLELIGDGLGFISATIIERNRAIKGFEEAEKTIGTAWTCLFLVLYVISDGGRLYYVGEPKLRTFLRDPSRPAWYDGFTVFAINIFHIVNKFRGRFERRSIRYMLGKNLLKIWKGIFVYRAKGFTHGLGSTSPKIRPLFKLYWSFWEFWVGLPFLLIPRILSRPTYFLYRKLKSN